jgi:hypothetical protein
MSQGGEGREYTKQQMGYMEPIAQVYGATFPGHSASVKVLGRTEEDLQAVPFFMMTPLRNPLEGNLPRPFLEMQG